MYPHSLLAIANTSNGIQHNILIEFPEGSQNVAAVGLVRNQWINIKDNRVQWHFPMHRKNVWRSIEKGDMEKRGQRLLQSRQDGFVAANHCDARGAVGRRDGLHNSASPRFEAWVLSLGI